MRVILDTNVFVSALLAVWLLPMSDWARTCHAIAPLEQRRATTPLTLLAPAAGVRLACF